MAKRTHLKQEVLTNVLEAKERLDKLSSTKARGALQGFTDFLRDQGVVGLAIGFVLGAQSKVLVDQMVASFINPLLGLILPGAGLLTERTFALSLFGRTQGFAWGALLYQIITFAIVALIVYLVFRSLKLNRLERRADPAGGARPPGV
jgi:large conductance mechanosensitive channel